MYLTTSTVLMPYFCALDKYEISAIHDVYVHVMLKQAPNNTFVHVLSVVYRTAKQTVVCGGEKILRHMCPRTIGEHILAHIRVLKQVYVLSLSTTRVIVHEDDVKVHETTANDRVVKRIEEDTSLRVTRVRTPSLVEEPCNRALAEPRFRECTYIERKFATTLVSEKRAHLAAYLDCIAMSRCGALTNYRMCAESRLLVCAVNYVG